MLKIRTGAWLAQVSPNSPTMIARVQGPATKEKRLTIILYNATGERLGVCETHTSLWRLIEPPVFPIASPVAQNIKYLDESHYG